jgi:hypothetical protein
MDESKFQLPAWLPWATTACLAALVACVGELWFIERARSQFLRDQGLLAETEIKGAENQLEAERIVDRRALESLRAGTGRELQVLLLEPPRDGDSAAPMRGAVAFDPSDGSGLARLSGGAAQPQGRDYQLWIDGPGPAYPADCGVFHGGGGGGTLARIALGAPLVPGCRLILVDGASGGARTLPEARAGGSIVLASPPYTGSIPSR